MNIDFSDLAKKSENKGPDLSFGNNRQEESELSARLQEEFNSSFEDILK